MKRRAVGTVVLSMALIMLALAILIGAHMIYYSLATYYQAQAAGRLSVVVNESEVAVPMTNRTPSPAPGAPMVWVAMNDTGPEPVRITQVVVVTSSGPTYYPYSAVLYPGQSVRIYLPLSGEIGVETNYGLAWARVVK